MGLWQRLLKFLGFERSDESAPPPATDLTYRVFWSSSDQAFRSEVLEIPEAVGLSDSPQGALDEAEARVAQAQRSARRRGRLVRRSRDVRGFHTRVRVFLLPPPRVEDED